MMSVQTFPCVFIEYVGVMVVNWRYVERQEDREVIPRKWDTSSFFFLKKGIKKTRFFFVSISSEQTPKGAGAKTKKINNSREEAGVWSWMQSGESS